MSSAQYRREKYCPLLRTMPFLALSFGMSFLYYATMRVTGLGFEWHLPGYDEQPVPWKLEAVTVVGSVIAGMYFLWSARGFTVYWNEYELSPDGLSVTNHLTRQKVTILTRDMVVTTVRRRHVDFELPTACSSTRKRVPLQVHSSRDGRAVYITNHLSAFEDFRDSLLRSVQHGQSSE